MVIDMTKYKQKIIVVLVGIVMLALVPIELGFVGAEDVDTPSNVNSPDSSGLMDILWTDDGDWWPDNDIARYRLDEAPDDETFYQWWYWMVKDLDTGNAYAMCYYLLQAPSRPDLEGVYVLFSAVTDQGKVQIWYKYTLDQLTYLGNDFHITVGSSSEFEQEPITDDLYEISGNMAEPTKVWTDAISYPGLDANSVFTWDLQISRIVGCCTQNDYIDDPLMSEGIKWNTFCFDGLPTGSIQMGSENILFDDSGNFRAYADMNFDKVFLGKAEPDEPEDKYRWSWASATKYDLSDPTNDISLIAGYGVSDNMFGLDSTPTGSFAAAYNVLGHNIVWKSIDTREGLIDVNLIEKCSWGTSKDTVVEVSIDAWDYFYYTDEYGQARIPHYQRYILEGEYVSIHMTFYVTADDINRLPSAYTEYTWSNFEALGCTAFVQIFEKSYKWWDVFHLNPINTLWEQFWDYNAGVEYGYAVDMPEI